MKRPRTLVFTLEATDMADNSKDLGVLDTLVESFDKRSLPRALANERAC